MQVTRSQQHWNALDPILQNAIHDAQNLPPRAITTLKHFLRYVASEACAAPIEESKNDRLKSRGALANLLSRQPISLRSVIQKLFEGLSLKCLNKIVRTEKLLRDAQLGFPEKHSPLEQLHRITKAMEEALEKGELCVAVSLNVARAFDRVWHEKLIRKLYKVIPSNLAELVSYLKGRKFEIRFDDAKSIFRDIGAGVGRGSVLAPLSLPSSLLTSHSHEAGANSAFSLMIL